MQRLILSQNEHRHGAGEHRLRGDREIHPSVLLDADDVDMVLFPYVEISDAETDPLSGDGNLIDRVRCVKFDIIEDVIGGVSDGSPLGDLFFRVDHLVRAVAQQKLGVDRAGRARNDQLRAQLLQGSRRFKRALKIFSRNA